MSLKNELLIRGIGLVNLIVGMIVALRVNFLLGIATVFILILVELALLFLVLFIRNGGKNE